jgi:hypothetical protein
MNNNLNYIVEFKEHFQNHSGFTTEEMLLFYQKYIPNINLPAIKTRTRRLVAKGIINRVGRGLYNIGSKNIFIPLIDNKLKAIYKQIQNQFPTLKFCIWHTSWFSEFMVHQPAIFYTIIETESDSDQRTFYSQSVFDFLKTQHKSIFHNPDAVTIQNYVSENRHSIIVMPLISEAPLQKAGKTETVTLEKMLVDIYCDEDLFAAQQGTERMNIFKEAFTKYSINKSKLLRYAARRTKRNEIENYLIKLKTNNDKLKEISNIE